MTAQEAQLSPKPADSFEAQKAALGLADVEMTPIEQVHALGFTSVEGIPEEKRIHPRFLTDFVPPHRLEEGHSVAYGVARFTPEEPSIKDRTRHALPHVPGPDAEHACLNLLRVVGGDLETVAPLTKLVVRHQIAIVPIDEAVLIELHDIKQGELEGVSRYKALGSLLFFLRDSTIGRPLAEVLIQYRDMAPDEI